jgi:hypothetical protein
MSSNIVKSNHKDIIDTFRNFNIDALFIRGIGVPKNPKDGKYLNFNDGTWNANIDSVSESSLSVYWSCDKINSGVTLPFKYPLRTDSYSERPTSSAVIETELFPAVVLSSKEAARKIIGWTCHIGGTAKDLRVFIDEGLVGADPGQTITVSLVQFTSNGSGDILSHENLPISTDNFENDVPLYAVSTPFNGDDIAQFFNDEDNKLAGALKGSITLVEGRKYGIAIKEDIFSATDYNLGNPCFVTMEFTPS